MRQIFTCACLAQTSKQNREDKQGMVNYRGVSKILLCFLSRNHKALKRRQARDAEHQCQSKGRRTPMPLRSNEVVGGEWWEVTGRGDGCWGEWWTGVNVNGWGRHDDKVGSELLRHTNWRMCNPENMGDLAAENGTIPYDMVNKVIFQVTFMFSPWCVD